VLNGFTSVYQAMIDYHEWSPARAAQEMDLIAAENKRHLVEDLGMKDLVDIVNDRQKLSITTEQRSEAEKVLFSAMPVLGSDQAAQDDEDGDTTRQEANRFADKAQ